MDKVFQWISDMYRRVTSKIPLRILHFIICFVVTIFSWELAIGLAIGRESCSFNSVDNIKDSIGDLCADAIGIAMALGLKCIL